MIRLRRAVARVRPVSALSSDCVTRGFFCSACSTAMPCTSPATTSRSSPSSAAQLCCAGEHRPFRIRVVRVRTSATICHSHGRPAVNCRRRRLCLDSMEFLRHTFSKVNVRYSEQKDNTLRDGSVRLYRPARPRRLRRRRARPRLPSEIGRLGARRVLVITTPQQRGRRRAARRPARSLRRVALCRAPPCTRRSR